MTNNELCLNPINKVMRQSTATYQRHSILTSPITPINPLILHFTGLRGVPVYEFSVYGSSGGVVFYFLLILMVFSTMIVDKLRCTYVHRAYSAGRRAVGDMYPLFR